MENDTELISLETNDIKRRIFTIRGKQVMLDSDLAELYQVETKNLNKASNRNVERFPEDFRFKLTKEEFENLRFQTGTSSESYGGRRYMPYVYTEQGSSTLSHNLLTGRVTASGFFTRKKQNPCCPAFRSGWHGFLNWNCGAVYERKNTKLLKPLQGAACSVSASPYKWTVKFCII